MIVLPAVLLVLVHTTIIVESKAEPKPNLRKYFQDYMVEANTEPEQPLSKELPEFGGNGLETCKLYGYIFNKDKKYQCPQDFLRSVHRKDISLDMVCTCRLIKGNLGVIVSNKIRNSKFPDPERQAVSGSDYQSSHGSFPEVTLFPAEQDDRFPDDRFPTESKGQKMGPVEDFHRQSFQLKSGSRGSSRCVNVVRDLTYVFLPNQLYHCPEDLLRYHNIVFIHSMICECRIINGNPQLIATEEVPPSPIPENWCKNCRLNCERNCETRQGCQLCHNDCDKCNIEKVEMSQNKKICWIGQNGYRVGEATLCGPEAFRVFKAKYEDNVFCTCSYDHRQKRVFMSFIYGNPLNIHGRRKFP